MPQARLLAVLFAWPARRRPISSRARFALTLFPGASFVPLAEAIRLRICRSSMQTMSYRFAMLVGPFQPALLVAAELARPGLVGCGLARLPLPGPPFALSVGLLVELLRLAMALLESRSWSSVFVFSLVIGDGKDVGEPVVSSDAGQWARGFTERPAPCAAGASPSRCSGFSSRPGPPAAGVRSTIVTARRSISSGIAFRLGTADRLGRAHGGRRCV